MAQTERELVKAEPLKISTVKVRKLQIFLHSVTLISDQGVRVVLTILSIQGGLTVASIENHAPVTTLGVVIKVTQPYYMMYKAVSVS